MNDARSSADREASSQPRTSRDLDRVGTVTFPTSCSAKVQKQFERAVAVLHSFFYPEARRLFSEVASADPTCAIAQWGVAMTYYHPIWTPPSDADIAAARAALQRTEGLSTTPREHDYIAAIAAFYAAADRPATGPGGNGCHGPTAAGTNRPAIYTAAMDKLSARYPDDEEAAAFHALALLGSAPPGDAYETNQLKAAAILEKIWKRNKDHPGAAHYLIHAYDSPALAERALPAAQRYAEIAPRVAHALHMPSHIFTRLGMWKDSVTSNLVSADAAHDYTVAQHQEGVSVEELHAFDYLTYAYLQKGDDSKAREIVDRVAAAEKAFPDTEMALAYAFGAIPSRYALERRAWKEAATVPIRKATYWAKFPFGEALIEYAHAIGRARSGDIAGARQSASRLEELRDAITDPRFGFFKKQVDVQHQIAQALIAALDKNSDAAVAALRAAAAVEDEMGKNPVSPGALLPARDLLGDLLLELGRADVALVEYESSLRIRPSRWYSLAGAAAAAERAGKREVARAHYRELQDLAAPNATRPELSQARQFLSRSGR
jgi:tetratricopeptide (TPR) repeat protein